MSVVITALLVTLAGVTSFGTSEPQALAQSTEAAAVRALPIAAPPSDVATESNGIDNYRDASALEASALMDSLDTASIGSGAPSGSILADAPDIFATEAKKKLAAPAAQFVVRSGTTLTLGGAPYRFTGLNIYNANSRDNCWYSLGNADGRLDAGLASIGAGQEVFRAWFFQSLATTNGVRDWSAFDHTLAVAKARGVKVIATLANQWGDCEEHPAGVYKTDSWYASGYRTIVRSGTVNYRSWVAEIAAHYRDDPTVMAWELMNEPENKVSPTGACGSPETLRKWAADVSSRIKKVDPNHLIATGTIGSGQCGAQEDAYRALHALPTIDLCSYHDYDLPQAAMPGDQWNGLQLRLTQCAAIGKPLFIGETGLNSSATGTLAGRATAFGWKFSAEFAGGAVGILMWAWSDEGSTAGYDIGPLDPSLALLAEY